MGKPIDDYLQQSLHFEPDQITVRKTGTQVMMRWEAPLMQRMAEIAAMRRGDVLEVGFGMGLSCDAVQRLRPRSHTIIEAHPEIVERAQAWAAGKPNTRIVAGRWQDVLRDFGDAPCFDGISFDVFGGSNQRLAFFERLPNLLRPAGTATLWLGDAQDLEPPLRALLEALGYVYRLSKVAAVPDLRCTYSHSNEFYIPAIMRRSTQGPMPTIR